jgi:hypothetical protein
LQAIIVGFARQIVQSIPQEMNITALSNSFGQGFLNGFSKTRVVVADHKLNSIQRPSSQAGQQLSPTGEAFPAGQLHGEYASLAFPLDPDRYQHGLASHRSVFPHLFVASI